MGVVVVRGDTNHGGILGGKMKPEEASELKALFVQE